MQASTPFRIAFPDTGMQNAGMTTSPLKSSPPVDAEHIDRVGLGIKSDNKQTLQRTA